MRFEKRFLHDIGRIDFALQAAANLDPREQSQIVVIRLQQLPQRGTVPRTSLLNPTSDI